MHIEGGKPERKPALKLIFERYLGIFTAGKK